MFIRDQQPRASMLRWRLVTPHKCNNLKSQCGNKQPILLLLHPSFTVINHYVFIWFALKL